MCFGISGAIFGVVRNSHGLLDPKPGLEKPWGTLNRRFGKRHRLANSPAPELFLLMSHPEGLERHPRALAEQIPRRKSRLGMTKVESIG